jgi:2-polyprenyl-6-methoxyphenol hydroxylase-like FAD-dependent oxidoreductase
LQNKLVNALGEQAAGSQLRFSTTVSSIKQRAQGALVRFDDGQEDVYDLVVGADGVRSSVRTLVFGSVQPRFCGQVGWRFLVPCPPSITGWTLYSGDRGVFIFIPVGHGQAYCYADAVVAEPPGDPIVGRLERLRSRFSTYASTVTQALAQLQTSEQVHFAAIDDIL